MKTAPRQPALTPDQIATIRFHLAKGVTRGTVAGWFGIRVKDMMAALEPPEAASERLPPAAASGTLLLETAPSGAPAAGDERSPWRNAGTAAAIDRATGQPCDGADEAPPLREAGEGDLADGRALCDRQHAEMERILLPDWRPGETPAGLRPDSEARAYQAQPAAILRRRRSLLLGDVVGLGKTYSAAIALLQPGFLPAAVVVQPHLQRQWAEKLEQYTTLRVHRVATNKAYSLPPADVYLFKYTSLSGWVSVFASGVFRTAVYDEIQDLRTGTASQKGGAALKLSEHVQHRLGLTGTPVMGWGREIFEIMRFIDPDVLGEEEDFHREWVSRSTGRLNNPQALGSHLRDQHVYLRRTKTDVGQQLPKVSRVVQRVEWNQKDLDAVEAIARQLAITATSGSFVERGQAARELDARVRHATGVAKAKGVAQYVRMLLEAGEPVLLAGWHRDVYDIWCEELKGFDPVLYTGSESPAQKDKAKAAFVTGQTDLMTISLRSGAGLDGLQHRCSTLVIGELDWVPGIHEQLIGRLDREGQTQPVTVVYLVADDGSDPPMVEVLGLKAAEAQGVTDPDLGPQTAEVDLSKLEMLAKRYLSRRPAGEVVS